jgi:hypothetical protein
MISAERKGRALEGRARIRLIQLKRESTSGRLINNGELAKTNKKRVT